MNKKVSVISIFLYSLAGLMDAFFVWSLINSIIYISNQVNSGYLVVSESLFDVVNYCMGTSVVYLLYASIVFSLGWIIHKVVPCKQEVTTVKSQDQHFDKPLSEEEKNDDNSIEWFEKDGE